MLIISRKENDSLVIDLGDELIEITVTEIGKQVRLGITAPENCKIWRKELYTTIKENKEAVKDDSTKNLRSLIKTAKKEIPSK